MDVLVAQPRGLSAVNQPALFPPGVVPLFSLEGSLISNILQNHLSNSFQ